MKINNKNLDVESELPSYNSVNFDVRFMKIRIEYLIYVIIPFIALQLFLLIIYQNPKVFFSIVGLIPFIAFLRIFDNKNHDIKIFGLYIYWFFKRKNYKYFGNTIAFLPSKPLRLNKMEFIEYEKKQGTKATED
ncbi:hypothetical protein GKC56_05445 [Neisseriaceae bacterium PsAf]|nr:hypothetical protein [Neisseriaceae bacterium PsAf]